MDSASRTSSKSSEKFYGYLMAFLAALFWGVSGVLAQFLFHKRQISPEWLVTVRMLVSGILLMIYPLIKSPRLLMAPWKNRKDRRDLIWFATLGMLAVQYTFFMTIQHSNAATATVLQYLGPVVIACYYTFKEKRLPSVKEMAAIALALAGAFLLVTHGSLDSLSISSTALFWGILSAFALATYSILPIGLLNRHDAPVVIGWAMLIGSAIFSFIHAPWKIEGQWDGITVLFTAGIILFGTALAFFFYLLSVKIIGATKASLLACAEPLAAAIISVIWLNVHFGLFDWAGTACILLTIFLLTKTEMKQ